MQISVRLVRPSEPSEMRFNTPGYPRSAEVWKLLDTYPRSTAREIVNVYIDEHEVSVQLFELLPRSTTWNQRPVNGSWKRANAFTGRWFQVVDLGSTDRFGCVTGRISSTSMVAMAYQPMARHHEIPLVLPSSGCTQLAVSPPGSS